MLKTLWKWIRGNVTWDAIKKGWEERSQISIFISACAWFLGWMAGWLEKRSWFQLALLAMFCGAVTYIVSPLWIYLQRMVKRKFTTDNRIPKHEDDKDQFERVRKTSLGNYEPHPTITPPFVPKSGEQIKKEQERQQNREQLAEALRRIREVREHIQWLGAETYEPMWPNGNPESDAAIHNAYSVVRDIFGSADAEQFRTSAEFATVPQDAAFPRYKQITMDLKNYEHRLSKLIDRI